LLWLKRGKALIRHVICRRFAGLALLVMLLTGCAATQKRAATPNGIRPTLEADEAQLLDSFNGQADAVETLNATVQMNPTAGLAYNGVIHQYHQVNGFVLAERPSSIRVIGQAPVVGTNIFDMVSDGQTFRIFIPSKNEFLVGPTQLERSTKNPIENLRPQHLLDAFFWTRIADREPVVMEQVDGAAFRYYVLTVLHGSGTKFELARKIWFDRADLHVSRLQIYGPGGRVDSDITYTNWQDAPEASAQASSPERGEALRPKEGAVIFPRGIRLTRPQQDYQLMLTITKLTVNGAIPADGFKLAQPEGTQLVNVGAAEQRPQP
jgi:outer membrane lipoprotein-sorting protein